MRSAPNERAADALRRVVSEFGDDGVVTDHRWCRRVLADLCPDLPAESAVLSALVSDGLPSQLVEASRANSVVPLSARAARLVDGSVARTGLDRAWATWGAAAWGRAYGLGLDLADVSRPHVSFFEAELGSTPGEVRLTWEVVGVPTLILNPGGHDVTGQSNSEVRPAATTTDYTLVATNTSGTTQRHVRVVVPRPSILTFAASPPVLVRAGKSELHWRVEGAALIAVDGAPVEGESLEVDVPSEGARFELVATCAGHRVRATCEVGVASVDVFEPVSVDGRVALTWSVAHVDHVVLEGVGRFAPTGRHPIAPPPRGQKFVIRGVTASGTTVRKTITAATPRIAQFAADCPVAFVGTDVKLRWKTSGVSRLTLSGLGDVTGKRGVTVPARAGGRYVLTAESEWGTVSRTAEVRTRKRPVAPDPPRLQLTTPPHPLSAPAAPTTGKSEPGVSRLSRHVDDFDGSPRTPAEALSMSIDAVRRRLLGSVSSLRYLGQFYRR